VHLTVCVFILPVAGDDYNEPSPPEVTFFSGNTTGDTACATYVIIDDDNLEFDHEFTVSLSTVTPTGPVVSTPSSTVVTITDDEGMHIIHYCCECVLSPSEKGGARIIRMYESLEASRTPPYGYLATGASSIGLQPPFTPDDSVATCDSDNPEQTLTQWKSCYGNDSINGVINGTMLCMLRCMWYAWQSYHMHPITAKRITASVDTVVFPTSRDNLRTRSKIGESHCCSPWFPFTTSVKLMKNQSPDSE